MISRSIEKISTVAPQRSSNGTPAWIGPLATAVAAAGGHWIRYSLVCVLVVIGAMKFTAYEAEGIAGFVRHSPLLAWAYGVFSVRGFSAALGVVELAIALFVAAGPWLPRVSAVGSLLSVGMFATTLSFMVTTPGVVESSIGFPSLSVLPGQFLVKDAVLMGASVWTLGESLRRF